jgi:hypothetical protein
VASLKQLFPGAVHNTAFLHLRKNACLVCSGARLGMRAETVQDHSATVGRNQTEARVTRCLAMSVSAWIKQQEWEPQTTQKTQMARLSGRGARLGAMALKPLFALFAVPLTLRRCNRLRAMTLEGYCQATQRVSGRLSENHRGLR